MKTRTIEKTEFHGEWNEIEASALPVRPGIPGEQPFWNLYSTKGFMFAPAFDLKEIAGATSYRFTVVPKDGRPALSFVAATPWSALSPVWNKIPIGYVKLTVEGVDGDRVVGIAGIRNFYRKALFDGKGPAAAHGYRECGALKLKHFYESSYVQYWLNHDAPDSDYIYYCYPSKMIGAVLVGLVHYGRINPVAKDKALIMARHAADFLIRISTPKGSFYPYLPPTYFGESWSARCQNDVVMMVYPGEIAMGYLDLYDATCDTCYFEAAERIATTFAKTQLPNGTWPIKVKPGTGEIVSKNDAIPIDVIRLFQRLNMQYGHRKYRPHAKKAIDWIIANPITTFNWEGQFEDVEPSAPYTNLSKGQACDVARYLLDHVDDNPKYQSWALEIIRFAEDQFVIWSHPNPDLKPNNWLTPCALEQYVWMRPINASASDMIHAWAVAYQHTGQKIFRLKAQAMANAMTVSQLPDGELPTYWHHTGDCWMNCSVYSAITMIKLEEIYGILS